MDGPREAAGRGAVVTIGVLLVDDQELVRTGFRMILQTEPDIRVLGEAADGGHAVSETTRLRPDVVLMDIRMPEMDGVDATRRIVQGDIPDPPRVLILTTFDLDEYVVSAIRAGASGFLLKDVPADELVRAIHVVARGEALIAPAVTRALLERFIAVVPEEERTPPPELDELTEREREVLRHVAHGLTNTEIAGRLYVSETTVKTHVSHVLAKLRLRDRVQAVVLAYETGLVRPGDA
jgi:DNA-binding NarL/FixJ family response regulator